jgi:outer membrane protein OmpA-like peptidoglycan-associated protein
MKKLLLVLSIIPLLVSAQEISIYGNRGMFKIQYAQPHDMGMFSFFLAPQERFQSFDVNIQGRTTTDRKHFLDVNTGLCYSIADFLEARVHAVPFMKWYEASDYPEERGDPYPPIGFKTVELGFKVGYPFILDEQSPMLYAIGVDAALDFGPGLSEEYFSNAWDNDRAFYADSFFAPYYIKPNFPPHIPHDPDYRFTALFDFRVGPFATHLNAGYWMTGQDKNPGYVAAADMIERPNYFIHGIGIELIPSEAARIMFEAYGMLDPDASAESLWVTPGLRFGSKGMSFDVGCEFGIISESDSTYWKAFFNFSAGVDLVKEVKVHIPLAKISGRLYDGKTNEPIAGTVSFPGSEQEAIQTAENGTYEVSLTPGSYRIHVEAPGYRWQEKGIVLKDGDQIVLDFNLNPKPVSKIIGKIYDAETKEPLIAEITFPQTEIKAITSDTSGIYDISLDPGTYRIHVEATNYQFNEKVVTLSEDEQKVVDIALTKIGVDQATLTGKVSEVETGKPLLAQLIFIDTNIPKVTTDPSTGIYKVTVPPGTYSVKVEAEDYVTESAPVVLAKDETKIENFQLKPIPKVGEKVVLKGIYFDFNSAVIKPESYPVLDDAAKVLQAKPKMRVEISGHTDSIGSDSYNLNLSRQRANSVRDYLIRYHNIDPSRLIAVGYGEAQPIADNRTKSGRDMNRRIEFKILSWE